MLGTPNNIALKATLLALRTLHLAGVLHNSFCPYFYLNSHLRRSDSFGEVQGTDITVIYH